MLNKKGSISIFFFMIFVLLGVMLSFGASVIKQIVQTKRVKYTESSIRKASDSIIGYAADFREIPDAAEYPSVSGARLDGQDNVFFYMFDNILTDPGSVCGANLTNLSYRICADATCTTVIKTVNNVAYILISSGLNRNLQTNFSTPVTSATTLSVYDGSVSIDAYTTDMNRAESFDDQYKAVTLSELRAAAGCVGENIKILNSILPAGIINTAYTVDIYAEGGIPYTGEEYHWCVETSTGTLPAGLTASPNLVSANCSALGSSSWNAASNTKLTISGTPTATADISLKIYARDNNGTFTQNNIAEKRLNFTIK